MVSELISQLRLELYCPNERRRLRWRSTLKVPASDYKHAPYQSRIELVNRAQNHSAARHRPVICRMPGRLGPRRLTPRQIMLIGASESPTNGGASETGTPFPSSYCEIVALDQSQ